MSFLFCAVCAVHVKEHCPNPLISLLLDCRSSSRWRYPASGVQFIVVNKKATIRISISTPSVSVFPSTSKQGLFFGFVISGQPKRRVVVLFSSSALVISSSSSSKVHDLVHQSAACLHQGPLEFRVVWCLRQLIGLIIGQSKHCWQHASSVLGDSHLISYSYGCCGHWPLLMDSCQGSLVLLWWWWCLHKDGFQVNAKAIPSACVV
ncbi:unnamed protein product [Linum trigynum]|uniref:Uncharacterized protein n=1 Tax=Linum trigynum TaxID=586398 RepID=A0AAV2FE12_9ROSI